MRYKIETRPLVREDILLEEPIAALTNVMYTANERPVLSSERTPYLKNQSPF
jgi:hypothetical protein